MRWFMYLFVVATGVFVCYHFAPKFTSHVGSVLGDKSIRAGKELLK